QTLGGYAGTGKSTLVRVLKDELSSFAVCAYTGKAANVLRKKGLPAKTIHSLIYRPRVREWEDENGKLQIETLWDRKPARDVECDGFIVDEASMVDEGIYNTLRSYKKPIIFVGDHGQLEPVNGNGFNLMGSPDITLRQVHRNAGEIAEFANFIRQG